jgi:hypothetical protein
VNLLIGGLLGFAHNSVRVSDPPHVHVRPLTKTAQPLGDIAVAGRQGLYVAGTAAT